MAPENEKLPPKSKQSGQSNDGEKKPSHASPGAEVQVSSANPDQRKAASSGETSRDKPDEPRHFEEDEESDTVQPDLEDFDWDTFVKEYTKTITEASEEEEQLLTDFDHLGDTFSLWAQAATVQDNERASKRLKTREQYVRLAENDLHVKEQHYTQVVLAFKNALALFGAS